MTVNARWRDEESGTRFHYLAKNNRRIGLPKITIVCKGSKSLMANAFEC